MEPGDWAAWRDAHVVVFTLRQRLMRSHARVEEIWERDAQLKACGESLDRSTGDVSSGRRIAGAL
eukprot:1556106-Rhodomonas_salina.4